MKKYYLLTVVIIIAIIAFFSFLSFQEEKKEIVPEIIFEEKEIIKEKEIISLVAPIDCEIGELVVLDASASKAVSFEWKVKPKTPNFIIIENGKRAFFSSPRSGVFLFVVAGAKGDEVGCVLHEISVIGTVILDEFTTLIRNWLPKDSNPLLLNALSRSFKESSNAKDIETLIKTTSVANRAVLGKNLEQYKSFLIAFSNYLQKNYQNATLEEHQELWLKIAAALSC